MDELNQVPTEENVFSDNEENLFEDIADDIPSEAEESTETAQEMAVSPFELKVKYNGEEKSLTEDEARTFAQKGMNYDRIYEPLERLARMNGMQVGEYINQLNDTQIQFEVSKEMDNLRNNPRYENVSDEVLEEIATNHVMENVNLQDKKYEEQVKGEADAQQARVQRDIDMFMQEYPEFKNKGPDALDQKVFDYVKQGYTLLEAYNKWSRETNAPKVETQAKISKQNEENRNRSLGNTTNAGNVEADDFMAGFLKE